MHLHQSMLPLDNYHNGDVPGICCTWKPNRVDWDTVEELRCAKENMWSSTMQITKFYPLRITDVKLLAMPISQLMHIQPEHMRFDFSQCSGCPEDTVHHSFVSVDGRAAGVAFRHWCVVIINTLEDTVWMPMCLDTYLHVSSSYLFHLPDDFKFKHCLI